MQTRTMSATDNIALLMDLSVTRRLPVLSRILITGAVQLAKWDQNARTRRSLGQLSAAQLRDIGITREQANAEFKRGFWES